MRKVEDVRQVDSMYSFGILLRSIRESLGLTQEELASKSGISRQMINAYEMHHSAPRIAHSRKLVKVLSKAIIRKVKRNE